MKKRLLAGSIMVLIAACAGDTTPDEAADLDTSTVPPAAETAPMTDVPAAPAAMAETAEFQEVGSSGVTGDARVAESGGQTEVMVSLEGAPASATMPGHIHDGTCDAIGGVVQPLQEITTDADGSGTMTATVELEAMAVMDGQHIVVYHGSDGTPVTCAPIPTHQM